MAHGRGTDTPFQPATQHVHVGSKEGVRGSLSRLVGERPCPGGVTPNPRGLGGREKPSSLVGAEREDRGPFPGGAGRLVPSPVLGSCGDRVELDGDSLVGTDGSQRSVPGLSVILACGSQRSRKRTVDPLTLMYRGGAVHG